MDKTPPILTLSQEILDWTLDHTVSFPKSHRFTFGQRLDNLSIANVELCLVARFRPGHERLNALDDLNLNLEITRTFWRIAARRGWIAPRQLFFATEKLDEIGRMAGAWRMATVEKGKHP
jgi:hypothetical protein